MDVLGLFIIFFGMFDMWFDDPLIVFLTGYSLLIDKPKVSDCV